MPSIEPIGDRPKRYSEKQIPGALTKIAQRSLTVDPREVQTHLPTEAEIQVAESFLAGHITAASIAKDSKVPLTTVRSILRDPVQCAWICNIVHQNVQHRLGMVDAAMLQRAAAGDTRAASLLYTQYGKARRVLHGHIHAGVDFGTLSDEDLQKMVASAKKEDRIIDIASDPA